MSDGSKDEKRKLTKKVGWYDRQPFDGGELDRTEEKATEMLRNSIEKELASLEEGDDSAGIRVRLYEMLENLNNSTPIGIAIEKEANTEPMEDFIMESEEKDLTDFLGTWSHYRCDDFTHDDLFSQHTWDVNNFDADFHSRYACQTQAAVMIGRLRDEMKGYLTSDRACTDTLQLIRSDIEEMFGKSEHLLEMMGVHLEGSRASKALDTDSFMESIKRRLHNVRKGTLGSLSIYMKEVEYLGDESENLGGPAVLIERFRKEYNFNGYEAVRKMEDDFDRIMEDYAGRASEIARNELWKRANRILEAAEESERAIA
ncbi:MAG: hypothetical protein IJT96_12085 [Lachnospiraceae bacterium]|nr:hypothetical protein [Lachnospiraceae bacterium]